MYLVVLPVNHCLQNSKGVLCLTLLMSVEDTLLRQPSDLMFLLYLLAEKLKCARGYKHSLCCSAIMPLLEELSILSFLKHCLMFYPMSTVWRTKINCY